MSTEPVVGTCGACLAYVAEAVASATSGHVPDPFGEGGVGRCRLRPELGVIAHLLPRCPKYVDRKTGATFAPPKVAGAPRGSGYGRERSGGGRSGGDDSQYERASGPADYGSTINLGDEDEDGDGDNQVDTKALRALLRDVLSEAGMVGTTSIGKRWEGGTLVLKSSDDDLKPKELPIEAFFHKIVMLRDRLRVLEQKINGHAKLSDADKVDMQQYITRIYGTLTTFNVLFRDKDDHFVGAKGDE